MDEMKLMAEISYTDSMPWFEFMDAADSLGEKPAKDDKPGWARFFETLRRWDREGLVKLVKDGKYYESVQLTAEGAARVNDYQRRSRMGGNFR